MPLAACIYLVVSRTYGGIVELTELTSSWQLAVAGADAIRGRDHAVETSPAVE